MKPSNTGPTSFLRCGCGVWIKVKAETQSTPWGSSGEGAAGNKNPSCPLMIWPKGSKLGCHSWDQKTWLCLVFESSLLSPTFLGQLGLVKKMGMKEFKGSPRQVTCNLCEVHFLWAWALLLLLLLLWHLMSLNTQTFSPSSEHHIYKSKWKPVKATLNGFQSFPSPWSFVSFAG